LLPLLGLGLAAALGAHPIPFLCSTLPGLACLITGTSLNLLGLHWTRRRLAPPCGCRVGLRSARPGAGPAVGCLDLA
jgi:hypothetical protein